MEAKIVQYGCGPVGCMAVKYALQRPDIEIKGAIDIDKSIVGRDLGDVSAFGKKLGIIVSDNAETVLRETKPDIVVLTTSSYLSKVFPQIEQCIKAGINVVSTAEELAYPYRTQPELADKINKLAKEYDVTVLGTGVNPGFLMDTWPLFMTGVCQNVSHIKAVRVQDAGLRRYPFQKKIGAGCTTKEFNKLVANGTLRHVGLSESIDMIASGLGWKLDEVTDSIEPVISKIHVHSDFITVEPGQVSGVRQVGKGICVGIEMVRLEFEAAIGTPESYDAVYITGTPDMEVTIKGGTHGDIATIAMTINSIHRVINAPPGLANMKDLPIVSALGIGA